MKRLQISGFILLHYSIFQRTVVLQGIASLEYQLAHPLGAGASPYATPYTFTFHHGAYVRLSQTAYPPKDYPTLNSCSPEHISLFGPVKRSPSSSSASYENHQKYLPASENILVM